MKSVTISDVAELAGVSKSTVSQYLNGRYDYMSAEKRELIKEAIEKLGYSPNSIARSLKNKKTKTIGVIVANILYEFSTIVTRAIEDVCQKNNYQVIICNADDNPAKEKNYIDMLISKQVDGIISFPTFGNVELYKSIEKNNFPLVFIDRIIPNLNVSTLLLNNEKASRMLVEELADSGYRRIAVMSPSPAEITPRKERIEGYKQAVARLNLPYHEEYVISVPIYQMQSAVEKIINKPEPPEAIIATNDLTLMEILKFVNKKGLNIPKDLAVASIDDVDFANFFNPTITTVEQPGFNIGSKAAEILINKIEKKGRAEDRVIRFEPKLNVRSSSKGK